MTNSPFSSMHFQEGSPSQRWKEYGVDSMTISWGIAFMSHINEMMTLFLVCSSCWIRINISSRFHLSSLLSAAEKQDVNLIPYLISCVKNKVTLGEIKDTFKEIFGIYVPKISFWMFISYSSLLSYSFRESWLLLIIVLNTILPTSDFLSNFNLAFCPIWLLTSTSSPKNRLTFFPICISSTNK